MLKLLPEYKKLIKRLDAAEDIRRLLHQFAAGFLKPMTPGLLDTLFGIFGGQLRTRRNIRDMTTTLNRIKAEVETA